MGTERGHGGTLRGMVGTWGWDTKGQGGTCPMSWSEPSVSLAFPPQCVPQCDLRVPSVWTLPLVSIPSEVCKYLLSPIPPTSHVDISMEVMV